MLRYIFNGHQISKALLCIGFAVLASSCSNDFLNVEPVDRIAKGNFFKTATDLNTAVIGVYAAQRFMYSEQELGMYNIEETRSDETNNIKGRQTEHRAVDNFTALGDNTAYQEFWSDAYNVINLANAVIDRGPNIQMDSKLQAQYIAEAKFIRAITYFDLVQDFGGIPLRLTETIDLSGDNTLARSSVSDVYKVIIDDLTFATKNLPISYVGGDVGRATEGAALGMLGKVYLQKGDKVNAITALTPLVYGNLSNIYGLLPNYADLWIPGNKNTKESLFEIQFLPPLTGAPFWNFFAPPSLLVPGGSNGNTSPNAPTQDLMSAFEPNDKRAASSFAIAPDGTPYIMKFKDAGMTLGGHANTDFPVLRYADILLLMAEAKGESTDSYALINRVRARAGLGAIGTSTPGTFVEKLLHERECELAFEMHRWHDLLRLLPPAGVVSLMNSHFQRDYPAGSNYQIDEHDLLDPIPVSELSTNSAATNNPGY